MGLEETVDRRTKTVKDLLGDVDWNGNLEFPPSPTPEERDACCLAEYIDSILGTNASEFDFSKWIRDREMEQAGQYISQMTMSAMFLISVFSPCGNMHESEARKVADLYFNKLEQAEGGATRVQKSRKISLKLRYDSLNYREIVMPEGVNTMLDTLTGYMEEFDLRCHPTVQQGALRELLMSATLFKQWLIVSGKEYKMLYCKPGILYDDVWMNAFDDYGKAVPPMDLNGRNVLISTCPALLEHNAHLAEPTNFREKRLFSTWKESDGFDQQNLRVVAKAIVLLK